MYIEIKLQENRIPAVDYLKGFSIFTIVMMHLIQRMTAVPNQIQVLAQIGGTGVHVFFVCSSIGLYLSYLKNKPSFFDFIKKRFSKIYFPYIIVVLISFFLPWMYSGKDRVVALLSHVFLFKMFVPRFDESFGPQLWFISTIIQLYLLFIPMCILKKKIKSNKLFFLLFFAISIGWWVFCWAAGLSHERIWNSFCLQYIWEFSLGFIIAELLLNKKAFKINNILLIIIAVVGISLQAGMALLLDSLKIFNDIPALFGYGALAILLMNISFVKRAASWLSSFSYELYLIHLLIFLTIWHFIKPETLLIQCLIGVVSMAIAFIVSCYYHKLIGIVSRKKKV